MDFNESFFIGLILGALIVFIVTKMFGRKTSNYVVRQFPDSMPTSQADSLFKSQTAEIAMELQQKLKERASSNADKQTLINITWEYADLVNQLNKDYAAYKIKSAPSLGKGPSTSPQ